VKAKIVTMNSLFFVLCIVIKLCNVNQQIAHFLNLCFNSILGVICMFQTSCVHHQGNHLYVHVQMVFLMTNTWCWKHVG